MLPHKVTFRDGRHATVVARSKPHAYKRACAIVGLPPTTLTRSIVALPNPTLTF